MEYEQRCIRKNNWALVLLILVGVVLGGLIGKLCGRSCFKLA